MTTIAGLNCIYTIFIKCVDILYFKVCTLLKKITQSFHRFYVNIADIYE